MSEKKRVLHVGCGPKRSGKLHRKFHTPDWQEVRLDLNPAMEPDIIASITDMSVVASGSYDAVWSSHNLEHLETYQVPKALAEFRRVLKPHGFLLITLPDLQSVAELIVQDKLTDTAYVSPAGPIAPIDMVFGFGKAIANGNHFMAHRTGFTARTLGEAIVGAGFASSRVRRGKAFDIWAFGYVTPPPVPEDVPIS